MYLQVVDPPLIAAVLAEQLQVDDPGGREGGWVNSALGENTVHCHKQQHHITQRSPFLPSYQQATHRLKSEVNYELATLRLQSVMMDPPCLVPNLSPVLASNR